MKKQNRIWRLLGKKTAGEASEEELSELDGLLGEERDIRGVENVLERYWEGVRQSPESEYMSTMVDSNRVLAEMKMKGGVTGGRYIERSRLRRIAAIAAVVLCLLGGGFMVYHTLGGSAGKMNIVSTKNGSRTEVTLPDGTKVWMNGGSELKYPSNFENAAKREITVSGEVFFDVKHDSSHPFVIHTQYLDIKDIGTVFNVKAYPGETAEATLISGSIEVNVRNSPQKILRLRPKEKVIYYGGKAENSKRGAGILPGQGSLQVISVKPIIGTSGDTIVPETAWTNNQFVFQSEPFSVLAERMERWYNVKMSFESEAVKQYIFTGIFEGETLEESLRELQMSRPFNYTITKDRVTISN